MSQSPELLLAHLLKRTDWRPGNCRAGLLACGYGLNEDAEPVMSQPPALLLAHLLKRTDWLPGNCRAGLLACGYGLNKTAS